MPTLKIIELDEGNPLGLLHWYPREYGPQPVRMTLDLESGELRVGPVFESGTPEAIYCGRVVDWEFSGIPTTQQANAFMRAIEYDAQTILDHSEIVWDGRNHIGRMDQDAESCFMVIEQRLAMVSSEIDDEEFDAAESAAWD